MSKNTSTQDAVAGKVLKGAGGRIVKVNHAGEFGAINIYRAQILVAGLISPRIVPILKDFLAHEKKHLEIFRAVLAKRGVRRCRSYWLCGVGGYALGFITALLGKSGIMACTAAVETVVTGHLIKQMEALRRDGDIEALRAVEAIVAEEAEHREVGVAEGQNSILYKPLGLVVSAATSFVIWLGMKL
ncbi:MAG TPA: demethoxyubiquinone hydroxylase family protein [Gammaproteobacteria bacterium]